MAWSLPGSSDHGISQVRILFPSPGDRPDLGLNLHLLHCHVDSLPLIYQGSLCACVRVCVCVCVHLKVPFIGETWEGEVLGSITAGKEKPE